MKSRIKIRRKKGGVGNVRRSVQLRQDSSLCVEAEGEHKVRIRRDIIEGYGGRYLFQGVLPEKSGEGDDDGHSNGYPKSKKRCTQTGRYQGEEDFRKKDRTSNLLVAEQEV